MNTQFPDGIAHTLSTKAEKNLGSVGAVVLAGGLSRRMSGQDKGLMLLARQPMVHYALKALLPVVDRCVINANRNSSDYERVAAATVAMLYNQQPRLKTVDVIPDTQTGHLGPLAGLSAGIEALPTEYVFMCPCDSPFLQPQLVVDLLTCCCANDADIAVAHDGDRLQPVFCLVNRRVKSSLDAFLADGNRKIDQWFEHHSCNHLPAVNYAPSFLNINTQDDLAEAEQALAGLQG